MMARRSWTDGVHQPWSVSNRTRPAASNSTSTASIVGTNRRISDSGRVRCPLRIGHANDDPDHGEAIDAARVGVLDVHAGVGEEFQRAAERAGFIRHGCVQDVALLDVVVLL